MFSQAHNNPSCLLGEPDPQTGTFSFVQKLGKLQANSGFGPEYDFQMKFDVLATLTDRDNNPTGIGRGFSFKLGGYSHAASTITLNSGESYKVLDRLSKWDLSHKLQDIYITKNEKGDEASIFHKNGDLEMLASDFGSNTDMYLYRYVAPDGRYLEFSYLVFNENYRLKEVRDNENTVLAQIKYTDSYDTTITLYPTSTKEKKEYSLNFDPEGLLTEIETPDSSKIKIKYKSYSDSGNQMYLIENVTYPTGATEEAEYLNSMELPVGAPVRSMPALSTHTKTIANKTSIETKFTYDDKSSNYWGVNSGVVWTDNEDGLFNCHSDYRYTATTTCGTKKTVTTYNKFHQTVETSETNGDSKNVKITTIGYYCDEHKVLEDQETRYELPKSKSMQIKDSTGGSQTLTEDSEYDDWGNLLSKTEPNGTSTVSVYYPAAGETGCPANPYGLVAYKKSETMKPNDKTAEKVKNFTYKLITGVDGNTTRCVVSDSKSYEGNTMVTTTFDKSNPKLQCATSGHEITIGGKVNKKKLDITFADESVQIKETLTAFDGATCSTSKTLSQFSGLLQEEVDSKGVITKYTYDVLDRVKSTVTSASTDYEITTTYSYSLNPNGDIGTLVSQKTSTGLAQDVYYDADQKELSVHREDDYGVMRKMSEISYDDQGRELTEMHFDYVIASDKSIKENHSNSVTKAYDCWGQVCEEKHNDGDTGTEVITFDPVKLTKTTQLHSIDSSGKSSPVAGATKITYNLFGQEQQKDVLALSGTVYSTTKYTFNGFGLPASITTPMSATASITKYDNFDRPLEVKNFDSSVVEMEYPAFTTKHLTSSMKLSTGYVIGQHEYDGLLRVTSRTVNDVKTKFSYETAYHKPSSIVNGRGQTVLLSYIPELGLQTDRRACFSSEVGIGKWDDSSKVSDTTFKFGKPATSNEFHGRIVSASSDNGSKHEVQYTSKGFVKSSKQTVGSLSKDYSVTETTMNGKPLQFTFDGRKMSISYDKYGRVVGSSDGDISAETEYDGANRVIKETVKNKGSIVRTTDVTFDEYSREDTRTIKTGGKTIAIKQEYDLEDKVLSRKTSIDSDTLTEVFTYDAKRRLLTYKATATASSMLPCNENGQPFNAQSFSYNELNNKTEVDTDFPNGDSDKATFTYDKSKQFQLNEIDHTLVSGSNAYPGKVTFSYDADGNVLKMNDSSMTYTISGRMRSKDSTSYSYDPFDRLVKSGKATHFYCGAKVIQEESGSSSTQFVRHGNNMAAQVSDGVTKIFGFNHQSSIVCVLDGSSLTTTTYSPFGASKDNGIRVGFNGELKDISDPNIYPLGNGTRSFFASTGRFLSSDTYSPFNTSGEINPYAYCDADPVNASDPTGHGLFSNILGMILGVIGLVGAVATGGSSLVVASGIIGGLAAVGSASLGFAADAESKKGHTKLADKLGEASFGLGIIGAALSFGSAVGSTSKVVKTRSLLKPGKRGDFYKFLNSDDAISFETNHSISLRKFRPRSSNSDFTTKTYRQVKVRPDGIFRGEEVPAVKRRAGGLIKTEQAPITKATLFKESGEMRSLHSTFKQTGSYRTMFDFFYQNVPTTIYSIVTFSPDSYTKASATPCSDNSVEQSVISAVGLPTNKKSYAYDESSDEED